MFWRQLLVETNVTLPKEKSGENSDKKSTSDTKKVSKPKSSSK